MTNNSSLENVDFDARYKVDGFRGVAFYLDRYATKSVPVMAFATGWFVESLHSDEAHGPYDDEIAASEAMDMLGLGDDGWKIVPRDTDEEVETGEFEEVEDRDWVIAIMVGDDREHVVEVSNLTKIGDDDYCHECGQIGCGHDGRDRS